MGLIEFMLWIVGAVVLGAVGNIVANEYQVFGGPVAERVARFAARRLPDPHRKAYEAEWLQLIADLPTPTAKLFHALSLLLHSGSVQAAIAMPRVSPVTARLVRVMDVMIATVLAISIFPSMLMIALAIKLDSEGPVFLTKG